MSVYQNHYVIEGCSLDPEVLKTRITAAHALVEEFDYNNWLFEHMATEPGDIGIIDDPMSGEVILVGRVIASGDQAHGIPITHCTRSNEPIEDKIKEIIGVSDTIGIYAFTRFH